MCTNIVLAVTLPTLTDTRHLTSETVAENTVILRRTRAAGRDFDVDAICRCARRSGAGRRRGRRAPPLSAVGPVRLRPAVKRWPAVRRKSDRVRARARQTRRISGRPTVQGRARSVPVRAGDWRSEPGALTGDRAGRCARYIYGATAVVPSGVVCPVMACLNIDP